MTGAGFPFLEAGNGMVLGQVLGQLIVAASRLLYEVPATLKLQRQQFESRLALDREHFEYERWRWEEERRDARLKAEEDRLHRLDEILKSAEIQLILANWPLKIAPSVMLRPGDPTPPPYVVLALPANMPERLAVEEEVRAVLEAHYTFGDPMRPVEFLGASWSGSTRVAEVLRQMATVLASEPALIVEAEEIGTRQLQIRLAFWGTFGKEYTYRTIASLPWPEAGSSDRGAVALLLGTCLALMIATFADGYHRLYRGVHPLLPSLLPSLLASVDDSAARDIRSMIGSSYAALFSRVAAEAPASEPDTLLELSELFAALEDAEASRRQLVRSIETWARLRGLDPGPFPASLSLVLKSAKAEDRNYLAGLECALERLNEEGPSDIRNLLATWPEAARPVPVGLMRSANPNRRRSLSLAPKARTRKKTPFV